MARMSTKPLTPLRKAVADAYLVDPTSKAGAYRAAGGKAKNASQAADEILKIPEVELYVAEQRRAREERTRVDADLVLARLGEMLDADPIDILTEDGDLRPIHEWPVVWRRMLNGMDVAELFEGRGGDRKKIGDLRKVRWVAKEKVIELLGKHIDVGAWRERIEHSGHIDVAQRILDARKRAGGSE